ncbi:homeodomain-interacting protein kinase 1-like [Poecilia formosa]|uniref:homeodomain-interacting protein kinase 1-like n=1 Tax=Poecilia formosa TaxID=48698 RepID=UPI0007B8D8BC|nr:PREDICTED: homeodomain-interacting protein kinase 1-like [Poecilia formosa]
MGNKCCKKMCKCPWMGRNVILTGRYCSYRVVRVIGRGVYGKVVKCKNLNTKEKVAIKMIRKDLTHTGRSEILNMFSLRKLDSDRCNLIKMTDHFVHKEHQCLAFEMLDKDLFEYMRGRHFKPLSVSAIRLIAQQMIVALQALKSIAMVHTDIKPDNIMFVNHKLFPFKVKLIDFGIAKHVSELRTGTWIQPDCYRAFEVLLGLPLSVSMDMWSLGCTLAFCYLGRLLFPSYSQYENMKTFVRLCGQPNNSLLNKGLFTSNFFNLVQETPEEIWELKRSREYVMTSKDTAKHLGWSSNPVQSFHDLEETVPTYQDPYEQKDVKAFINLLKQMIVLDPDKRISPSEAHRQDFITMKHLVGYSGKYVIKARKMVGNCHLQPIPEELR